MGLPPAAVRSTIMSIFRYLDPSGEGSVSEGEWNILLYLWKEINLSIREFVKFLERSIGGGCNEWWTVLDEDGSNGIDYDEWSGTCKSLGYFGPSRQIFKFMDKEDKGEISKEQFG